MLTQIYHKRNELQEVEFFEDAECTVPFDFTGKKNLYILLKDGDITPLIALDKITPTDRSLGITAYVPYIPNVKIITNNLRIITLDDITPNLSKYIPEDDILMFIGSVEELCKFNNIKTKYTTHHTWFCNEENEWIIPEPKQSKKITIFLPHGTQSELEKANEIEKELIEKYGVKEVNLLTKHCFKDIFVDEFDDKTTLKYFENNREDFYLQSDINNINKIITTNSTGILNPEDSNERLQVIDCKEIFEEYLKENNL